MTDFNNKILEFKKEAQQHLTKELLPFWFDRCKDVENGGFLTHFDKDGNDTGVDEKSMLGQARCIYSFAAAHRAGYGEGKCLEYAKHGVDFLIEKMWDPEHEGFFWLTDRKGNISIDEKIIYGHSFIIYAFSEYTLASGDSRGLYYAEKCFDLLQKYGADTMYGGYFEMFHKDWTLKGAGAAGGDRKTLDVHMHLMEAFTTLYECSGKEVHKRKLLELIDVLTTKIIHPKYLTGIPQFTADWKIAPQIKFDIVWGWDRFSEDGIKSSPEDNTSYGHNVEFAWLLMHAIEIAAIPFEKYNTIIQTQFDHALADGIDWEYGGVYVEGSHAGGVTDREKEFWQQAEMLIALLQACIVYGTPKYLPVYENVHRFVFDKMINHDVGEWIPLLTRQGEPIWRHMSHNWKINYHTMRAVVQSIERMNTLLN
ncbi:AGE family epimerase/isomerase [Aurantibacter crassamenti]|uniref:AGE family epimerase/isomerase n=1 Tax=Aurantibacter crassamenti TaxID=1837375 RepID=UPI00193A6089|nr:AGE family epimerase/isomerase [Aurantibacter crassamenti]MBM1105154.1 AGE family epimerase/isomerase [Aurantibacter crassamenti]